MRHEQVFEHQNGHFNRGAVEHEIKASRQENMFKYVQYRFLLAPQWKLVSISSFGHCGRVQDHQQVDGAKASLFEYCRHVCE